ncbi:MAG: PorT family protein [Flavobacteriales bacterium]|nr:PorT family protein [Flavobacteriales bacterium]
MKKIPARNGVIRYFLILMIALASVPGSSAQVVNPLYDLQKVHFGFSIIGSSAKLKYTSSADFMDFDTMQTVRTLSFPGFGVGGIVNFRLLEYWDFRTMVNIQFVERHLDFGFKGGNQELAEIRSTYMEIPMQLKYKSKRYKNARMYLIGGATYRHDFASDIETDRSNTKPIVALYPNTFSYDLGVGLDLYYEYFKFSPEFRVSNGLNNQMAPDEFIYSGSITRMSPKLIQFILHFEG